MLKRTLYLAWRSLGWLTQAVLITVTVAAFVFAATVLGLRYWLLPNIGQYRETIADAISQAAGQRVAIGSIEAHWDGYRPHLVLGDVAVLDKQGQPALRLERTENTLSWMSLFTGKLRFYSIEMVGPSLHVRRDAQGDIRVAGISITGAPEETGFADWLLRQPRIVVRNARIAWEDEKRSAPPLILSSVELQIQNRGARHRFGLRAAPPPELAAPFDLRGDLRGESLEAPSEWSGQVFVQLDYTDLDGWGAWIPYPIPLSRGAGALRMWISFDGPALSEVTADVRLRDLHTRLAGGLPEIDLMDLQGRVGWKTLPRGFELATDDLSLATRDGRGLQPTDFVLRAVRNEGETPGNGELRANFLDLGALVALSEYLPLEPTVRQRLQDFSPRGRVEDLVVKWSGEWPAPRGYAARGRFTDLALRPQGKIPGFSGVSGSLDGTETGGTFSVSSRQASLELPLVFRQPLAFDTLTAQASWRRDGRSFELKLGNVGFVNEHLAGSVHGTYWGTTGMPGTIDLTGNLSRADARFAGRYIPLVVNPEARLWLDKAFLGGSSRDVRLRLKGDLADFPFPGGRKGLFEVTAKVADGTLDYADGWPKIDGISGDLVFRGSRMDVNVSSAAVLGARLTRVRAAIPDLSVAEERVEVEGEAEGPTSELLRFVEASPVDGYIDGFTRGLRASGSGRLALKLNIPLRRTAHTRVGGSYRFLANDIDLGRELPGLEQFTGQLDFTESSVKLRSASGTWLGGPISLEAASQGEGAVRIAASGRLNLDNFRGGPRHPLLSGVHGATDWRGSVNLHRGQAEWVIESSLVGLRSELPAPFTKAAGDSIALRVERRPAGPGQALLSGSYGRMVSWSLLQRAEQERSVVERGAVSFGGTAQLPERKGLWVSGALAALELDQWRALLGSQPGTPGGELSGLNLRVGALDALGKRFNDVQVNATSQAGTWQVKVAGRELNGDLQWQTQGRGRLVGRLRQLAVPADSPAKPGAAESPLQVRDYPALDLIADDFGARDKQLGRLELIAEPHEREWKVEKLKITNPEGTLQASGQVQGGPSPRTQLRLTLDVLDAGKLLGRLGYPGAVRSGNGKLEGNLGWAGAPYAIDYPTLTGNLKLEVHKGQFLKIEPGAGKLLGILSLQALKRRLLFDFRDVVDAGFEFDSVAATATIGRGLLSTKDFIMNGASARVTMSGDVNLAAETQNLKMKITPSLAEGVSLTGALVGGPVVGAATLFVSKAFKDPVGQLVSAEYDVTGTWTDPVVSKVTSRAPGENELAPGSVPR